MNRHDTSICICKRDQVALSPCSTQEGGGCTVGVRSLFTTPAPHPRYVDGVSSSCTVDLHLGRYSKRFHRTQAET